MIKEYLEYSIKAVLKAGKSILRVYHSEKISVKFKKDESPLTLADKRANRAIKNILRKTKIPILSEEGRIAKFSRREKWDFFWLIDPLDGTVDFLKKNDEFTVNIALICNNEPILGVIYAPVSETLYIGEQSLGSLRINLSPKNIKDLNIDQVLKQAIKLPLVEKNEKIVVIGSRSHLSEETKKYYQELEKKNGNINIISKGSSLKLCLIAEGTVDIYPRFGPTMEWDIAAGQAIVSFAGGSILNYHNNQPLEYNKKELINPWFVAKKKPPVSF